MYTDPELHPLYSDIYWDALRLSKNFVKGETYSSKKELQLVLLKNDGSLIATNSVIAMKVEKAHGFIEDYLINPFDLEMFMGEFFDLSIPLKKIESEFENENEIYILNTELYYWLNSVRELKSEIINTVNKDGLDRYIPVYLELLNNKKIAIRYDNLLNLTARVLPFDSIKNEKILKIKLNLHYLVHCLEVMVLLNRQTSNCRLFVKKDKLLFQDESGLLNTILFLLRND